MEKCSGLLDSIELAQHAPNDRDSFFPVTLVLLTTPVKFEVFSGAKKSGLHL
jgi:hypothetical protein